jgi:hypothetical protein
VGQVVQLPRAAEQKEQQNWHQTNILNEKNFFVVNKF